MANWQPATAKDEFSVSADPFFVSDTNLHAAAIECNGQANPNVGIATDIDGEIRNANNPDIGADEFYTDTKVGIIKRTKENFFFPNPANELIHINSDIIKNIEIIRIIDLTGKVIFTTSGMKQYNTIKRKYPDALLLFRVGDFYETFGEDAIRASKVLGIVLTRRANGAASYVELAGFPHHSLDTYLPNWLGLG